MHHNRKSWRVWLIGIWLEVMALFNRPIQTASPANVDLSQVASEIRDGQVQKVTTDGNSLLMRLTGGKEASTSAQEAFKSLEVELVVFVQVRFRGQGAFALV